MTLYYDRINQKQTGIFRNEDETIISTDPRVKTFWEPKAPNEDLAFDDNGFPYVKTYAMQADGTRYSHYFDTPDADGVYQPDIEKIDADTQASLDAQANIARDEAMLAGSVYTLNGVDYTVSFTKDDGDGMVQVKNGFELGLTDTTIHFENGTKMPISAAEFPTFALWFVSQRNQFFI